jgi:hypothetical protein
MPVRIFVEKTLQDARGDPPGFLLQPAGEVADQLPGLVGIVQSPRLTQCVANGSVQRLWQTLQNVSGLVALGSVR